MALSYRIHSLCCLVEVSPTKVVGEFLCDACGRILESRAEHLIVVQTEEETTELQCKIMLMEGFREVIGSVKSIYIG